MGGATHASQVLLSHSPSPRVRQQSLVPAGKDCCRVSPAHRHLPSVVLTSAALLPRHGRPRRGFPRLLSCQHAAPECCPLNLGPTLSLRRLRSPCYPGGSSGSAGGCLAALDNDAHYPSPQLKHHDFLQR